MTRFLCLSAFVLSLLISVSYFFSGSSTSAQDKAKDKPAAVRWEYKVIDGGQVGRRDALEKSLNDLGAEGWEVAGTTTKVYSTGGNPSSDTTVILKRRK